MDFPNSAGDWLIIVFILFLLLTAMLAPSRLAPMRENISKFVYSWFALLPAVATAYVAYFIATSEFNYSAFGKAAFILMMLTTHTATCRLLEAARERSAGADEL